MIPRTERVFTLESPSAEVILRAFLTASVTEPYVRARVRVSGKADRAEGLLRLRDTDTSLIMFRERVAHARISDSATEQVLTLEKLFYQNDFSCFSTISITESQK